MSLSVDEMWRATVLRRQALHASCRCRCRCYCCSLQLLYQTSLIINHRWRRSWQAKCIHETKDIKYSTCMAAEDAIACLSGDAMHASAVSLLSVRPSITFVNFDEKVERIRFSERRLPSALSKLEKVTAANALHCTLRPPDVAPVFRGCFGKICTANAHKMHPASSE